jgi:hypothetical protein
MAFDALRSIDEIDRLHPFLFFPLEKGGQGDFETDFLENRQAKHPSWTIWQNSHAISTLKWKQ